MHFIDNESLAKMGQFMVESDNHTACVMCAVVGKQVRHGYKCEAPNGDVTYLCDHCGVFFHFCACCGKFDPEVLPMGNLHNCEECREAKKKNPNYPRTM